MSKRVWIVREERRRRRRRRRGSTSRPRLVGEFVLRAGAWTSEGFDIVDAGGIVAVHAVDCVEAVVVEERAHMEPREAFDWGALREGVQGVRDGGAVGETEEGEEGEERGE